jgi:hypothetical protein
MNTVFVNGSRCELRVEFVKEQVERRSVTGQAHIVWVSEYRVVVSNEDYLLEVTRKGAQLHHVVDDAIRRMGALLTNTHGGI